MQCLHRRVQVLPAVLSACHLGWCGLCDVQLQQDQQRLQLREPHHAA